MKFSNFFDSDVLVSLGSRRVEIGLLTLVNVFLIHALYDNPFDMANTKIWVSLERY